MTIDRRLIILLGAFAIGLIIGLACTQIPVQEESPFTVLGIVQVYNATTDEGITVVAYGEGAFIGYKKVSLLPIFGADVTKGATGWLVQIAVPDQQNPGEYIYSTIANHAQTLKVGKISVTITGKNVKDIQLHPLSYGSTYTYAILEIQIESVDDNTNTASTVYQIPGPSGQNQPMSVQSGSTITLINQQSISLSDLWKKPFSASVSLTHGDKLKIITKNGATLKITLTAVGTVSGRTYTIQDMQLDVLVANKKNPDFVLCTYYSESVSMTQPQVQFSFSSFITWQTAVTIAILLMAIVLLIQIYQQHFARK